MTLEQLAELMFNAYNYYGIAPWKTFDGRKVPQWDDINVDVQSKWRAAAEAARDAIDEWVP